MIEKVCSSNIVESQEGPRAVLVPTDEGDNSYVELKLAETDRGQIVESREYRVRVTEISVDEEPAEVEPVPDAIAEQAEIDAAAREAADAAHAENEASSLEAQLQAARDDERSKVLAEVAENADTEQPDRNPEEDDDSPFFTLQIDDDWVDWPEYRKTSLTHARRIEGPFRVETRHGVVRCEDGYLAIDEHGFPYPIAADEFDEIYVEATEAETKTDGSENAVVIVTDLEHLTADGLRAALGARNLDVDGTKPELAERLQAALTPETE